MTSHLKQNSQRRGIENIRSLLPSVVNKELIDPELLIEAALVVCQVTRFSLAQHKEDHCLRALRIAKQMIDNGVIDHFTGNLPACVRANVKRFIPSEGHEVSSFLSHAYVKANCA